jgi:hypothetical protein
MCNLYSITKNQAAIRDLFKVTRDITGKLQPRDLSRTASRRSCARLRAALVRRVNVVC